jgi:hypothetical protein
MYSKTAMQCSPHCANIPLQTFDVSVTSDYKKQSQLTVLQAGGRLMHSEIRKLNQSIWNKEELPQHWKESITAPVYKN